MTTGGGFKRDVRREARAAGQRYTQVLAARRPQAPLPVLLTHVLLDLARSYEEDAASLLLWANLLRVIPDGGITAGELPAAACISRRAVKAWQGPAQRRGWLDVDGKVVRLTAEGRQACDRWRDRLARLEPRAPALRASLQAVVGQLDLELPHYPMTYGTADQRTTGGTAVAAQTGPPRIPAHGTDWVPVVRTDAAGVSALPLHALLSQVLTAFAIDYEERSRFAMPVAALLGRAMPTASVPLASLPRVLGVNGLGKSSLERHGVVRVTGTGKDRVASLTDTGVRIRDQHAGLIEAVTDDWRGRYGAEVLSALTAALADRNHGDLPGEIHIRYTPGRGFEDVSTREA